MKVSLGVRVVAKLIDLALVLVVGALIPWIGPLVAIAYSLLADGMRVRGLRGQSIGKRLMRLKVVQRSTGEPANLKESAIRNSPVGLATLFAIASVWGWVLLVLIGLPLMLIELYLMARVESGHRLGDVMADTEVRRVGA